MKNKKTEKMIEAAVAKSVKKVRAEADDRVKIAVEEFVTGFLTILKDQQTGLEKQIADEMEKVRVELEEYRTARKAQIDKMLADRVNSLAHEILGQTISPKDHQELIIKAIETARKEGIFD